MNSIGYALARAGLIRVLTAYSGITTADGAVDGTTLVDSNLIGRNDFITEKAILIMSGDAKDEDKGAAAFDNGNGQITLQGTGFSAQIKAGTVFRVLNISSVETDVAIIDGKIGNSTDPVGISTLFAWLAKIFSQGGQGLVYYGKVTQVDDAIHFRVAGLTGLGDSYFANTYWAYVVRDAAGTGAAPQGEMQPCTGYTSTDGIFTHTAFSVSLAVDDEVLLIHERVAQIKDLVDTIKGLVDTAETDSSYTYLNAGGEQDVYEDTANTRRKISFAMDINAMTQGGVVRVYLKLDGTNYRVWTRTDVDSTTSGGTEDVYTFELITNQNVKVTYQEDVDEGADRSIPYSVVTQVME